MSAVRPLPTTNKAVIPGRAPHQRREGKGTYVVVRHDVETSCMMYPFEVMSSRQSPGSPSLAAQKHGSPGMTRYFDGDALERKDAHFIPSPTQVGGGGTRHKSRDGWGGAA